MISNEWRKKLLTVLITAGIVTVLGVVYTALIKQDTGKGFVVDLADVLFLWGLTLLCFSLIYKTRFFGFYDYMRKMFTFGPPRKDQTEEEAEFKAKGMDEEGEPEKRDASLVFASLVVIAVSFILASL